VWKEVIEMQKYKLIVRGQLIMGRPVTDDDRKALDCYYETPVFEADNDRESEEIIEAAEILIKYSGYIRREQIIADKINRLENIHIKGKFDYNSIQSLSTEARQKLTKIDPDTIAQASRIPGISPSDINILLVLLGR
jgi:tRNA uridine 5-carboxymethylaminomethyl modification enzyme